MAKVSGMKRRADEESDPMTSEINLKATPPYDPKQEEAPCSILQSQKYSEYKELEQQFKRFLTKPLADFDGKDGLTETLIDLIEDAVSGAKQETIMLCLTGRMNTGKSSTLNSIFSVGPIAREGDAGGSCTLASCMYRKPKKGQEQPFVAEVRFFERQERRDILAQYLAAYYRANHSDEEEENDGGPTAQNAEDKEADLDIRNEVIAAMIWLFGDRAECRTKQAATKFLDTATSSQDEAILTLLYSWCDALILRATGNSTFVTVTASTAGELNKNLEDFTANAHDDDGNLAACLTPMVSLITFYFDDPLTRLGIVFLDTPGTSDCNKTRKKSANLYRRGRTHCLILSDEARAKDDSGISKEVKTMHKRGPGRTVVVMTRSDIINEATNPPGSKRDKETVQQRRKDADKVRNELNAMEIEEQAALDAGDDERAFRITKEKRTQEIRLQLLENAEKAKRIGMRSESNRKFIEEKLEDVMAAPVPVLSVSNTEYAKHLKGYAAKKAPILSVEQTNIPALRQIISAFPNEARLNEVKHQQEVGLPSLLARIRLYTAKTSSDRKEELEVHVQSPLLRYQSRMTSIFGNLRAEIQEKILTPMRVQEGEWNQAAAQLCDAWRAEFKTGVFHNLMKRDGHRKGRKPNREVDLSAELMRINSKEVDRLLSHVPRLLHRYQAEVYDDMEDLVADMEQQLKDDSNERFMSLGPFYDAVRIERRKIKNHVNSSFEKLLNGLDEIHQKATSEEDDAYLVEAMLPIYNQVEDLKAKKGEKRPRPKVGWPEFRKITFKNEVTKFNGIWATVHAKVESAFLQVLQSEAQSLVVIMGTVFNGFLNDFNLLCETKDSGDSKVHEELNLGISKAQALLDEHMRRLYESLEKDFRGMDGKKV